MKKNGTNSKNTVSETEKGLKHLRLVGVGREYAEKRFAEMQKQNQQEISTAETTFEVNNRKLKK